MKKYFPWLLSALACLLAAACLYQCLALKQQLLQLEQNINGQLSAVQSNVGNISAVVQQSLQQQGSLLASGSYTLGSLDAKTGTVAVDCTLSPKEYTADTQATLLVDGEAQPMTQSNGVFTARLQLPLSGDTQVTGALFRDGDTTRSEALDWTICPGQELVQIDNSWNSSELTVTARDNEAALAELHLQGSLWVSVWDSRGDRTLQSAALVLLVDGQEQKRIPVELSDEQDANLEVDETFQLPYGSPMELCVEVQDRDGFCYRTPVEQAPLSEDGRDMDDGMMTWWGLEPSIYSPDGQLLYQPQALQD